MSATLASAMAGSAKVAAANDGDLKSRIDQLSNRIGCLEEANVIRDLHARFEYCLDKGLYEELLDFFAEDAEVIYNGGEFVGRGKGVRRLFCDRFAQGRSGKKIEPAPGFEPALERFQDCIEVAPDRMTANARFGYSIQVGTPLACDLPFLDLARLQGQGILEWWEAGVTEISYVKTGTGWKIRRLEFRTLATADFKPGRRYAKPFSVTCFSETYPANPTGPDRLVVRS